MARCGRRSKWNEPASATGSLTNAGHPAGEHLQSSQAHYWVPSSPQLPQPQSAPCDIELNTSDDYYQL